MGLVNSVDGKADSVSWDDHLVTAVENRVRADKVSMRSKLRAHVMRVLQRYMH